MPSPSPDKTSALNPAQSYVYAKDVGERKLLLLADPTEPEKHRFVFLGKTDVVPKVRLELTHAELLAMLTLVNSKQSKILEEQAKKVKEG